VEALRKQHGPGVLKASGFPISHKTLATMATTLVWAESRLTPPAASLKLRVHKETAGPIALGTGGGWYQM
jgi:hypothetical protein